MSDASKIEWTDATWNPVRGCVKISDRMQRFVRELPPELQSLPHVWLGVSVENVEYGLPRVEHLRRTPAQVHFLSVEPLLGDLGPLSLDGIEWVIVGGESGPGARPMAAEWARALRDRCFAHDVPFFFKQWGGVRKAVSGRLLDGRCHDAQPAVSAAAAPPLAHRRRLAAALGLPFGRLSPGAG